MFLKKSQRKLKENKYKFQKQNIKNEIIIK